MVLDSIERILLMPVPEEIRAVERPVNTVIHAYGKNHDRYAVIQRIGCRRKNQSNQPVDGKVIGHIINMKYIPVDPRPSQKDLPPTLLTWGNVVLCDHLFSGTLEELCRFYTRKDALRIYCIAILRVCWPHLKDNRIKHYYDHSFLSLLYPDVGLCANVVSKTEISLGSRYSVIQDYMRSRVEAVGCDDTLLIDGTLKTDDSFINSFSHFSYKGKLKGRKDISVLYAYNLTTKEPVCSKVFPGNMLDATSYQGFLSENHIEQGLMVDDKGFPPGQIREYLKDKPGLCYLTPLKRNVKKIEELNLYEYEEILDNYPDVVCVKRCGYMKDGTKLWYYSYKDQDLAKSETASYMNKVAKNNPHLSRQKKAAYLQIMMRKAGTIVFESNLEMSLSEAYEAFNDRWKIETMMGYYKTACGFDDTREEYNESVIGSEFIDFFSTLLTCQLRNYFQSIPALEKLEYKEIMTVLSEAIKVKPTNGDWILAEMNPSSLNILYYLGLIKEKPKTRKAEVVKASMEEFKPRKRGRPPKPKDPNEPEKPKRPRGRPPKPKDPNAPEKPKRPRGRPRKNSK